MKSKEEYKLNFAFSPTWTSFMTFLAVLGALGSLSADFTHAFIASLIASLAVYGPMRRLEIMYEELVEKA